MPYGNVPRDPAREEDDDPDEAPETPTDEPPPIPVQDPPPGDQPPPPLTVSRWATSRSNRRPVALRACAVRVRLSVRLSRRRVASAARIVVARA